MVDATSSGFEITAGGNPVGSRRAFSEDDIGTLREFAATYADLVVNKPDESGRFLELGNELLRWIDGSGRSFSRAIDDSLDRRIEFRATVSPGPEEWAFLSAPWEVLARDGDFLAAGIEQQVAFSRRLGPPSADIPPLDSYRLGLTFMASSPRGQVELDFEAEESSILESVGDRKIDLIVEESGNITGFRDVYATEPTPAVHLTCHGINNWRPTPDAAPQAVLLTEDEYGDPTTTSSADLIRAFNNRCRFAFVSACLTSSSASNGSEPSEDGTAEGGLFAHSMTSSLVRAGVPAVLGWAGSVLDGPATAFAARLYDGLANQRDVAAAVADARQPMIDSEDDAERRNWHLARLWLGPEGGGPIVAGSKARRLVPADAATQRFLDRKHVVPVADAEMFVGRRRETQTCLRVLDANEKVGVLIQGMGRLGKSSLAARIASRKRHALAVVHGAYDPLSFVDAVAQAVENMPAARELIDDRREAAGRSAIELRRLLIDLLSGPCAQQQDVEGPLLLVVDDLEQILESTGDGETHLIIPEYAEVIGAVIGAFAAAHTDSRLIITSRFTFELDDLAQRLHHLPLGPFKPTARQKLALRQRQRAANNEPDHMDERIALVPRVLTVAAGNPGLQDLVGARMLYSPQVQVDAVEQLLGELESWLKGAEDLPSEPEVRAFLEGLAVDHLVGQADAASRFLLSALKTFELPIPLVAAESVAETIGGSIDQLIGLGVLDVFEDVFAPQARAVTPTRLVAGRLDEPGDALRQEVAAAGLPELFDAWGGVDNHDRRPAVLDVELTRVACTSLGVP
ncbi:MAG: CHAT domain-containing protein [Actinomycetota bacterium]